MKRLLMKNVMKKAILLLFISILSVLIIAGCGGGGGGKGGNGGTKVWTSEEINGKIGALNSASSAVDKSNKKGESETKATQNNISSLSFKSATLQSSSEGEYLSQFEWNGPDTDGWYTATNTQPGYILKFKSLSNNSYKFVTSLTFSSEGGDGKGYSNLTSTVNGEYTMIEDDKENWHGSSISKYFNRVTGYFDDGVNPRQAWDNTNKGEVTLQVISAKMDGSKATFISDDSRTLIDLMGNEKNNKIHSEYSITLIDNTYNLSGTIKIDDNPAEPWNESWPKN